MKVGSVFIQYYVLNSYLNVCHYLSPPRTLFLYGVQFAVTEHTVLNKVIQLYATPVLGDRNTGTKICSSIVILKNIYFTCV